MKAYLILLCILLGASKMFGQELVHYRRNDVFAENLKANYLESSIRIGIGTNFQIREIFTNSTAKYIHWDNNYYKFSGRELLPGIHLDHEFTFIDSPSLLIPKLSNKVGLTGYLNNEGGYKIGVSHYQFSGYSSMELSIEVVIKLQDIASGGFIFARDLTNKQSYYQLGYRYDLSGKEGKGNWRAGWSISRANLRFGDEPKLDKWNKFKLEIIYSRYIRNFPNVSVSAASSRSFLNKIWNFEIGVLFDINLVNKLWLK